MDRDTVGIFHLSFPQRELRCSAKLRRLSDLPAGPVADDRQQSGESLIFASDA